MFLELTFDEFRVEESSLSPDDCDKWIAEVLADFHDEYVGSTFHKVIYWKLEK